MNELMVSNLPLLSGETELPEELLALLSERIARYTMGDSTSVTIDTAQRLLEGIWFCVALNEKDFEQGISQSEPLRARWNAGVAQANRLAKRAKLLLKEAEHMQPPLTNLAFRESLGAMPAFFRSYDADFFAQEIPCPLDYPLCQPVSDALTGVEYMTDYLRRWLTESSFLRMFQPDRLQMLYERYYVDYEDLVVNLYLPVAEMATLCALCKKPVCTLLLKQEDSRLVNDLLTCDDETVRTKFLAAADSACDELEITGLFARNYLRDTALDFSTRLIAAHGYN